MKMASKNIKGSFGLERIFDETLEDLVRGLRNNKNNETRYITQSMNKIKEELSQESIAIKANAVAKLTYLQMLGYDITWAAFKIIEVMSSAKFTYKRIGYLSGSQSFHKEMDVLVLITNTLKKDLRSQNMYEAAAAMSSLACYMTPSLAKYLLNDVLVLLNSTKAYLRKIAVLLMYHFIENYPSVSQDIFHRLKEKVNDIDGGVRVAVVNVICELAPKYPDCILRILPEFITLMNCATNNWMVIKLIKLCVVFVPMQPTLEDTLKQPFTDLIYSTTATSLLYECINAVVMTMSKNSSLSDLCAQKLKALIEATDRNLKYLGLSAMSKYLKKHKINNAHVHRNLVISCLEDTDDSIRLQAIGLLYEVVSKFSLMSVIETLLLHLDNANGFSYREKLIENIIGICSQNNFALVTDFKWYIIVLFRLAEVKESRNGNLISDQLVNIAVRIKIIRKFIVSKMSSMLEHVDPSFLQPDAGNMHQILKAAAWICGEYARFLKNPTKTLKWMLRVDANSIDTETQRTFIQSAFKIYAWAVHLSESMDDMENAIAIGTVLNSKLEFYIVSNDLEVQERSCNLQKLVEIVMRKQANGVKMSPNLLYLRQNDVISRLDDRNGKISISKSHNMELTVTESSQVSSGISQENVEISQKNTNLPSPDAENDQRFLDLKNDLVQPESDTEKFLLMHFD